ncbi:molybdopterin-dependent oxidoreductase [Aeromicrobium sp.]|uniref:molybdopterin-dependent oxidoreductase n=1 Tax=Aeromicrobium sp. TaxID=1871063 RepID=UPI0019B33E3F|nr:molybdopterin-dependent oxidoreductase [Aeromicrobium sp.]MBC7633768.1 molybdopterin-dependent oxidoreductase [Aeromicrobium sp.]
MRLPRVEDIESRIPRPEDFESRARGTALTARVGMALGIAFSICFLTGIWSHWQYQTPGWLPLGPNPTQLYRFTQGTHILSGIAAIPLLLVKLWSVFPRLFIRPPTKPGRELVIEILERASIGVLVAAAFFQLSSGLLNIAQWYPWNFSFRSTHYAVAWISIGAILVHIAVKLPAIRKGLGVPVNAPVDKDDVENDDDDPDAPTRRMVLQGAFVASGLAVLLTAGQTVPFLRKVSVFAVRDGNGPQDLPINRTASGAGSAKAAMDPNFVLEIVAKGQTISLSRDQLLAMPQRTHRLPITCVEGWSRNAVWTGPSLRDVIAMVGAPADSDVTIRSMQTKGAFGVSVLPANYVKDHRALLALELNGETLSLDHGYPCRIIAPNRPGVFQTKWVRRLEVKA